MSLQNHDKYKKKHQEATKQKKLNTRGKKETATKETLLFQFHPVSHVVHTTPGTNQSLG